MRIGILTLPFNNNYGGFLQAFALKSTLNNMQHEVIFIMRRRNYQRIYTNRWKNLIKYIFAKDSECQFLIDYKQRKLSVHTNKFINRYLRPWSKEYFRTEDFEKCPSSIADIYISGSDQCWRAKFAPDYIDDYFFKFLKGTGKKRISYAASFGTDVFEFSLEMQKSCTSLLAEYSAISVREASGISILENYFGVPMGKTKLVLDPTLLLQKNIYEQLITDFPINKDGYIFVYILDETPDKKKTLEHVTQITGKPSISQKAQTGDPDLWEPFEPVELWLSKIYHSDYVLTDSFHGVIFSILFNKPFLVYGNNDRGATRFSSLLKMFELEDRYIEDCKSLNSNIITKQIDWDRVNYILERERNNSLQFLINSISRND